TGVKYANNEIYFDIVEEIDAIVDSNGSIVSSETHGSIQANCRLSGMPDLTLSFINPNVLDDCSFHPCVRYNAWEKDKLLSFIPPDGHFQLMSYRVNIPQNYGLPIFVKPQIQVGTNGGKFDISVSLRNTGGKAVENILLEIPLGTSVSNIYATCNVGSYIFDPATKCVRWDIGKINPGGRTPLLSGDFNTTEGSPETGHPISVHFTINMYPLSGLKVDALKVYVESYKPYKGVRSLTKAE
ncbi:3752_t:CDS:2, partial [Paraglomus occultum]